MPQATPRACRLTYSHGQPPSTGTAVPFGASDPAIQASGSGAQTSCCARSGNEAASHSQTLMRLATHAVDPHPCPISAITSMYVRMLVWDPPKRFGTIRRQRPLSRRAPTTSSGRRRSESVCAALRSRTGLIARARAMSASRSTASLVCVTATSASRMCRDYVRSCERASWTNASCGQEPAILSKCTGHPYARHRRVADERDRLDARGQQQQFVGVYEREELVVDRRVRALGDELRRVCIAFRSRQVDTAAETFLEPQHGAGDRIDPDATARAPERINPTALAVPPDARRFGGLWLVIDALRAAGSESLDAADGKADLVAIRGEQNGQRLERERSRIEARVLIARAETRTAGANQLANGARLRALRVPLDAHFVDDTPRRPLLFQAPRHGLDDHRLGGDDRLRPRVVALDVAAHALDQIRVFRLGCGCNREDRERGSHAREGREERGTEPEHEPGTEHRAA